MLSRLNLVACGAAIMVAAITVFLIMGWRDRTGGAPIVITSDPSTVEIAVWVDGAVEQPGVYRLGSDARLNDAVQAAGGLTASADLAQLNLAARLTDEEHIVIPVIGGKSGATSLPATPSTSMGVTAQPTQAPVELININTATAVELDALPGIGPVLAERIVTYRNANGPYQRIEELARVDGISPDMVDKLRDSITVGP